MTSTSDTHMAPSGQPTDTAIERFIVGDCAEVEAIEVEKWLRSDGEDAAVVRWLRGRLEESVMDASLKNAADLAIVKSLFAQRIDNSQQPSKKEFDGQLSAVSLPRWASLRHLAWVVPIFPILGLFTWNTFLHQSQESNQATYHTYETRSTQLASYQLPDGSSITLAPESRMRFNTEFGSTSREVFLEGAALFTVTRSSGVPFVVRTRAGSTTVLGTTFSIREYATDAALGIVVAEGKVAFRSENSSSPHNTILATGDLARVANAEPVLTHSVDVSSMLAWTSGRLIFTETPLRDAIPDIKRWYGLDVIVTDNSLLSATITGSLSEKTPSGIATALARAIRASVRIAGRQMIFSPLEPR